MNIRKLSALLTITFFPLALFGFISEQDQELNRNIDAFPPVYCNVSKVPISFWNSKYNFILSLENAENITVNPRSSIDNIFLGYTNGGSKLLLSCESIDPAYHNVISNNLIDVINVKPGKKTISYRIPGKASNKKVFITVNIKEEMKRIGISESARWLGLFKSYSPKRTYSVSLSVNQR